MLHYKAVATTTWQRGVDLFMCVLGGIVMLYTTGLTVVNWADSSTPAAPGYCDGVGAH